MKKKLVVVAVLFTAVLFILPSCTKVIGEGPLVTETRVLANFTGVSSEMCGRVNISIAPNYRVEVIAQQNILNVLQTNIVNGVLRIDFKNGVRVKEHEDLTINIMMPAADYFRVSGSGNMDVLGDLFANNLGIKLSGSGSVAIQKAVVANKINAEVSGSGNISIVNGSAIDEELDISGSGKIDLAAVAAENAVTKISGSGNMKVALTKKLDATISGSGSVYYHGNPIITTKISGSGRVVPF